MATLTLRNVDDAVETKLRMRAAAHGRSMEEEAHRILSDALDRDSSESLVDLALELFGPAHGIELEPHPGVDARQSPQFDR